MLCVNNEQQYETSELEHCYAETNIPANWQAEYPLEAYEDCFAKNANVRYF